MHMAKQKELKKQYPLPKWYWITLVATVLVVIGSIAVFLYWQTGWPGYLHALGECGGRPPVEGSSFMTSTYINPGDDKYRIPGQGGYRMYFCTEDEAQSARFKHVE